MIRWTGTMAVHQTDNGIVCRWYEGQTERSRSFPNWRAAAAFMDPLGELNALDRELFIDPAVVEKATTVSKLATDGDRNLDKYVKGVFAPSVRFDPRDYWPIGTEGHHPMMAETLRTEAWQN